jgi:hypothetical protein
VVKSFTAEDAEDAEAYLPHHDEPQHAQGKQSLKRPVREADVACTSASVASSVVDISR